MTDAQLRAAQVWLAGFDAGAASEFNRPKLEARDLTLLWQAAWMSGRKCLPLMRGEMDEHRHQTMLFRWAEAAVCVLPRLALMYAVPNGGKRDLVTAAKLKQEGVKPGVPDVCLPVPRGGYAGLYVEMKAERGRLSADQREWIAGLEYAGNRAVVCFGWREARQVVANYLMEV